MPRRSRHSGSIRFGPCEALRRQGYQFLTTGSSAAVKPCLWCKSALRGGDQCYKHRFYGIESHRCIQMTPTLRCTHRCLFCWRSFEHNITPDQECPPEEIVAGLMRLQKKALAGFIPLPEIDPATLAEALCPRHVAISLAGEPTLYSRLPELINLLHHGGYTTFLVSNGTRPEMLARCRPTQLYLSLNAPDRETYQRICRPVEDTWERICESLGCLSGRRSAVRITLVRGENDFAPDAYARLIQDSGASFIEVKGYMYLGSSRLRLSRTHMPEHEEIRSFAMLIADKCDYRIRDESPASRVVLLERYG